MPNKRGVVVARLRLAGVLALLACSWGCQRGIDPAVRAERIGLSASLPILWGESDDPRELLAGTAPRSWAGDVLAGLGDLVPLDTLADPQGKLPLPLDSLLIMAQPCPLTPRENVALDDWVKAGGRLLLFVDPMLTQPSRFPLGDPRRPQDMAMLSPILAHWGLELQFDPAEQSGEWLVPLEGGSLPVNLPGRFRLLGISGDVHPRRGNGGTVRRKVLAGKFGDGSGRCSLEAADILADCRLGRGRVLALADAALFENLGAPAGLAVRRRAFLGLIARLQADSGPGSGD